MNPYEPPDIKPALAKREAGANPARVMLYIVGSLCVLRGLSLFFNAFFEIALLAFGGTAIWLARQDFRTQTRFTTLGWSVSAILLALAAIAIDPPSTRDVSGIAVVGLALVMLVAIAWIAFRGQPIDGTEQRTTSSDVRPRSPCESSDVHDRSMEWSWWLFGRWSFSLSVIAILSSILTGVAFFCLIVIPVGHFFDVRLARFAFNLPVLVVPGVWIFGMIRCHRKYPSKSLLISLGIAGVALYASLPVILYFVIMSYAGGWNVR